MMVKYELYFSCFQVKFRLVKYLLNLLDGLCYGGTRWKRALLNLKEKIFKPFEGRT